MFIKKENNNNNKNVEFERQRRFLNVFKRKNKINTKTRAYFKRILNGQNVNNNRFWEVDLYKYVQTPVTVCINK